MPQTINTNISSLNAQRNLNTSQGSLATSMGRLSSGLRVNSAKDDAAGLAIADRMNAQGSVSARMPPFGAAFSFPHSTLRPRRSTRRVRSIRAN